MKAFLAAVIAAVGLGVAAMFALSGTQELAYQKFSTVGARVDEPGHNLVGHSWTGDPGAADVSHETHDKAKEEKADAKKSITFHEFWLNQPKLIVIQATGHMREAMKGLSIAILLAAAACPPAFAQDAAPAGPANLCKELIAFAKPPAAAPEAPKPAAAAGPAQPTAVNAAGGAGDKPSAGAGEVQQKSGLSGPVPTDGPSSNVRAAANAAAKAAAAPAAPVVVKPTPEQIAQAEAAASAQDPAGCRAAFRTMRQAGVTIPAPLLALAALDLKHFAPKQ